MRMATALVNPATQIKLLDKFSDNKAQAIGLNFCISFCFNSLAISSVTLFVTKPLLGLILVSDILILLAIICYFITRASSSK
jgi:inner membrane protein involved in colicin E2 resistance